VESSRLVRLGEWVSARLLDPPWTPSTWDRVESDECDASQDREMELVGSWVAADHAGQGSSQVRIVSSTTHY